MATAPEISLERLSDLLPDTRRTIGRIISELAQSVRERDLLTYDHSRRVGIYAGRLARHTGWSRESARNLALAGLVHDLGKTWIQNAVLHKPSALSADERAEMQRHPVIAARILQIYAAPEEMVENVLHHHEAFDGHGYPSGLAGEAIPLGARILSIADVFDALTSARPYREAMTCEYTRDWIVAHAGTHFDPALVAAFVGLLASRSDFLILPRVQTLTPIEAPDGWQEPPRGRMPRKSLPRGRAGAETARRRRVNSRRSGLAVTTSACADSEQFRRITCRTRRRAQSRRDAGATLHTASGLSPNVVSPAKAASRSRRQTS